MPLSENDIEALAPKPEAWTRAQATARTEGWQVLGRGEQALWGRYFQFTVGVDLQGPSFYCDCESRENPCKHALALLILQRRQPQSFAPSSPPELIAQWLDKERRSRINPRPAPSPRSDQRLQERLHHIAGGLVELRAWLYDVAHSGLADLAQQSPEQWDRLRARLVDAKAPGLAQRIEQIQAALTRREAYQEGLHQLGLLYLYLESFEQLETLPPELQQELQNQAGINLQKKGVLQSPAVADRWLVLGRRVEVQARIDVQRTWLQGQETGRLALLLDFAVGKKGFDTHMNAGQAFEGELCFYPGGFPLRALPREGGQPTASDDLPRCQPLDQALYDYAEALGQQPWLDRFPLLLQGLRPAETPSGWSLLDAQRREMPLDPAFHRVWDLLALSGGQPISLMGEWDGYRLYPLGAREGRRWVKL